jgi:hypothetical protein
MVGLREFDFGARFFQSSRSDELLILQFFVAGEPSAALDYTLGVAARW